MKRALVVLAACGAPAPPTQTPRQPATTCDEAPLRTLAAELGDAAPAFELEPASAARTASVLCPADATDEACEAFGRSHVQLGHDERIAGVVVRGRDAGAYEMVIEVDGARRTETFATLEAAEAYLEELKALGHEVVPTRGQRMTVHDTRAAVVAIANPATPLRRKVVMHLPPTADLVDVHARVEAAGFELVKWDKGAASSRAIATCP